MNFHQQTPVLSKHGHVSSVSGSPVTGAEQGPLPEAKPAHVGPLCSEQDTERSLPRPPAPSLGAACLL